MAQFWAICSFQVGESNYFNFVVFGGRKMFQFLEIMKDFIFGFINGIFISVIFFFGFVYEFKQQNENQIKKENVTIQIKDTLQIDNRNFSIIVIDSIEYLCYKSGSKLELIKHK